MTAPVQVLVVGFDDLSFSGEALAELTRLDEAGIVRLVDLMLVWRGEDGDLEVVPAPDGVASGFGDVTARLLGHGTEPDDGTRPGDEAGGGEALDGDRAPSTAWSLADAVPPGTAAAVVLIEHLWAAPLTEAIRRAGGRPLDETWLAPEDRTRLDALLAGR